MTKLSDALVPSMVFDETADGSISTPSAGTHRLFFDDDGVLKEKNDAAVVTEIGLTMALDGWTSATAVTWTYASGSGGGAASFTIAGVDHTAIYQKGTYLRLKQGGSYKYFVVTSSSFSTDTTVNIMAGSDYTLANAAITDNYYSYQVDPQGWPGWFNYVPTVTGYGTPTVTYAKFCVLGRRCDVKYSITGTSNATTLTFLLPVDLLASSVALRESVAQVVNSGTTQTTPGHARFGDSNTTTVNLYRDANALAWTGSGTKTATGLISYET